MTRNIKRLTCITLGFLALALALGFIGGVEQSCIAIDKGLMLTLLCELAGAILLWKGGVIK